MTTQPTEGLIEAFTDKLRAFHYEAFRAGVCYGRDEWPSSDEEWADLDRGIQSEAVGEHFEGWASDIVDPVAGIEAARERLHSIINTPETGDFMLGVPLEAAHQRERWGSEHDAGKTAFDWFWLVGYLAQKAASAQVGGDHEKALHHTISTAAALANWHLALTGADNSMRPGIEPPRASQEQPQ